MCRYDVVEILFKGCLADMFDMTEAVTSRVYDD